MESLIPIQKEIQALCDELQDLRRRLENEASDVTKLRQAYDSECRRVPSDDAKLVAAKVRFDVASARMERIYAGIAEKERLLDEAQGREAEGNRRREAREEYRNATKQLSESKSELDKLTAEYRAMLDKLRVAEWRFQNTLRTYVLAKGAITTAPCTEENACFSS